MRPAAERKRSGLWLILLASAVIVSALLLSRVKDAQEKREERETTLECFWAVSAALHQYSREQGEWVFPDKLSDGELKRLLAASDYVPRGATIDGLPVNPLTGEPVQLRRLDNPRPGDVCYLPMTSTGYFGDGSSRQVNADYLLLQFGAAGAAAKSWDPDLAAAFDGLAIDQIWDSGRDDKPSGQRPVDPLQDALILNTESLGETLLRQGYPERAAAVLAADPQQRGPAAFQHYILEEWARATYDMHVPRMRALVAAGINPDTALIEGRPAMIVAAEALNRGLAEELLKLGASPDAAIPSSGTTARQIAASSTVQFEYAPSGNFWQTRTATDADRQAFLKLLREHGAR